MVLVRRELPSLSPACHNRQALFDMASFSSRVMVSTFGMVCFFCYTKWADFQGIIYLLKYPLNFFLNQ